MLAMRHWCVLVLWIAACHDVPAADVTIDVDPAHPGAAIPDDYAGASYETSTLIGGQYFRADNAALLRTFARLGIHHLRLGGNEADRGALPTQGEIDAGLAFADAANVPVIYTLRLLNYDAASAAVTAKAILDRDAARVACFSIGNEPGVYLHDYLPFRDAFDAYVAAIADPRAHYCGTDEFGGAADWVTSFAMDRGASLYENTVHEYFGGNGANCDAATARDRLLSPGLHDEYAQNRDAFAAAVLANTGFRISETNSYFNGGCIGASDTFASTLWGLDYLYWWASHDARGLDFHTGDHVSGTSTTYSLFVTSTGGYHVRPLGYAMAAFDLGSHGRLLPVTVTGGHDVRAYATVAPDASVAITIIDAEHGDGSAPRTIELAVPGIAHAALWRLEAPAIDATDGVTLGGAAIDDQADWVGQPETPSIDGDTIRISIAPGSAVVLVAS
jgi:hypothetical protein